MEFQETLVHYTKIRENPKQKYPSWQQQKWRISFHRPPTPPKEFICPISGSLMTDPVIVSSGHTFERACVRACKNLNFTPTLPDGAVPDLSTVIPNLALKTTILNWYSKNKHITNEPRLDISSAEKLLLEMMERKELLCRVEEVHSLKLDREATELTLIPKDPIQSPPSSDDSVGSATPTPLAAHPSCLSLSSISSSSEIEPVDEEEEELLRRLKSAQAYEVEEALVSLRKTTKAHKEKRTQLCTVRLLSVLRSLIVSRYVIVQVNAVACLVNLSLEKVNKVKMVRCGVVPFLIDVLKGGFPEAQGHASGAIFSLALDDFNKTAIGVLGALPPLLHLLRSSENELTRNDSALALYHLSFVRSNRTKLIRLGAVPVLLGLVNSGRVLLLLCNLASSADGRIAILDAGGVGRLVGVLGRGELETESTREGCVSVLLWLSYEGLRFKGLAKAAGAGEVLSRMENCGSERCEAMVRKILEAMKGRAEEEKEQKEAVDWEALLDSRTFSRTGSRLGGGKGESDAKSSEF